MPRPKDLYGTRGGLLRRLWKAVKKTSKLLDSDDPQVVLRATHALATIAASYRAAYAEWEQERTEKNCQKEKQNRPPLTRIDPYIVWLIKRDVYGIEEPPPPLPQDPEGVYWIKKASADQGLPDPYENPPPEASTPSEPSRQVFTVEPLPPKGAEPEKDDEA